MDSEAVPVPLRERLGPAATTGLLDLLEAAHRQWRDDVIVTCRDGFDRRVVEEAGKLRWEMSALKSGLREEMSEVKSSLREEMSELKSGLREEMSELKSGLRGDMSELKSSLRQEMTVLGATLRQEMTVLGATLRQETTELGASVRGHISEEGASLRAEMAAGRVELLKWCFLFWVGQVVAVAGVVGVMLQITRP
jgi:hypothetical protein